MSEKLGVRFSPHILADLVRIGAMIISEDGFTARLIDKGIPDDFKLINSGVDRETGEFFLIFGQGGRKSPDPVKWQAPVYEKNKEVYSGTVT